MVTVKRLYLYGVLAVVLLPLLVGISDMVQLVLDGLSDVTGAQLLSGSRMEREELSLAIALVAVGAPLWGIHLWLLHRSVHGAEDESDERSSSARATYFLLVLVATLAVVSWFSIEILSALVRAALSGERMIDLGGPIAYVIVFGCAWLLHISWRAGDLRVSPERTAGDWLTRLYLYGALLLLGAPAIFAASEVLTVVLREAAGLRPAYESPDWWREGLAGPVASLVVLSSMWLAHWSMAARLAKAPDPMGSAHRGSRTRTGYLLGVVLLCAATVLVMLSSSLGRLISELAGAWGSSGDSRLIEEVAGPIVASVPFVAAWWWHARRAAIEGLAFGGPDLHASVVRSGRLLVALVGLAGLAVGLAWGIESALSLFDYWSSHAVVSASMIREGGATGAALTLLGLAMWLPAWLLLQRERASDGVLVVRSTARRAYLLLVSGLSLVAVMGALSWLLFQVIRSGLDAGRPQDVFGAIGVLFVGVTVLAYHLLVLRSDSALARTETEAQPAEQPVATRTASTPTIATDATGRAIEALEISGPPGADFEALNTAIRTGLPEGFAVRVLPRGGG